MNSDIQTPSKAQQSMHGLRDYLRSQILGQSALIDKMMIALLADGHLLVEGAPGLAKTRAIRALADGIHSSFQRIQFTPDLLPGDITGTDIFRPQTGNFEFQAGPLFHNLILADEINRAPAKVQAALLEAMAERQISVGKQTYPLSELFLVMATQNPIEQEGTYPLPEAQLDRFLLHVLVDYPDVQTEKDILHLVRNELRQANARDEKNEPNDNATPQYKAISEQDIFSARREVLDLHMAEAVEEYIVQLVVSSRNPAAYSKELAELIEYGASPRATLALDRCARAQAWLDGSDFVSPENVQAVAHDVLRHRVIVSYQAEAQGVTADQIISQLIALVPVI
jgi:MoxR-like ATPase